MKLILEEIEDVKVQEVLEEGTGKKSLYIEGIFLQGGIKNRNGRLYPVEILSREVSRYNEEYVKKGRAFGELGHPNGPQINLDRISHMHKELRQEGNNFVGKAKIMDTPCGNIARALIADGANLGVSSRGMGSLRANRDGVNEVQSDFRLATAADIVVDPSAPDAWVNGVMESKEWILDPVSGCWKESVVPALQSEIDAYVRSGTLDTRQKFRLFEKYLRVLTEDWRCAGCGQVKGQMHSNKCKGAGNRVSDNDMLVRSSNSK